MALSDDQRALLRLLAQREDGYEDIAALKGKSIAAVREEVRAALEALDAPPPEPPAPAPPVAVPEPPAAPAPAQPDPQPAPAAARPAKAPAPKRARSGARPTLPADRRRLLLLTGGALGLVALVLGAVALFSGGGDGGGSSPPTSLEPNGELTAAEAESGKVTQAVLSAADGGDASGRAIFGRVGKKEIVLQVTAENLEPTDSGQSYIVWLYRTPKLTLRVGSVPVGESGRLGARFAIPAELLAYVASGAFNQVYVSRTDDAAYQREVARAKAAKTLPRYTGETVLTGPITGPIAKAGR